MKQRTNNLCELTPQRESDKQAVTTSTVHVFDTHAVQKLRKAKLRYFNFTAVAHTNDATGRVSMKRFYTQIQLQSIAKCYLLQ
jgi:predicted N-acetyltransferase YhbS